MNPPFDSTSLARTASEIVEALDQAHHSPPLALLARAADRWHYVRDPLLARVDREIEEIRQGLRPEYSDAAVFALYLAAEKNSPEAFPVLLRLLSVQDIRTAERFGEVFADDMPVILADCYPGEEAFPGMAAILINSRLPVACRRAVLNALEILAWQQRVAVSGLRGLLERLADGAMEPAQPRLWAAFAEVCLAAGLHELEPVVLEASSREWIDSRTIPRNVLISAFAQVRAGSYEPFSGPVTIASAAAEVESWDWERAGRESASPGRTGRNDPCPCGSGRKFKRCCAGGGR